MFLQPLRRNCDCFILGTSSSFWSNLSQEAPTRRWSGEIKQFEKVDGYYELVKTERDQRCKEKKQLEDEISDMIRKLAQESCRSQESEAITVSCSVLAKETEQLKKHLENLTKDYENEKAKQEEIKKNVQNLEALKSEREYKLHQINKMEEELIELKAKSESHKHIRKDEADVKNLNEKLSKKQKQLEKDLKKLKQSEEEIEKVIIKRAS
ncbi:hypothetical protein WMY93_005703 [Mugilogobius chulae]|uniref:Uncharacterized protein n=1 Tax=Mugilogobius chulae TaxID=88201 RepID=A0AAW0PP07_9GOBI